LLTFEYIRVNTLWFLLDLSTAPALAAMAAASDWRIIVVRCILEALVGCCTPSGARRLFGSCGFSRVRSAAV
jgi:hypothetical protein